jgi:hypothetical protein
MTFEAFEARRRSGLLEDADTHRLVVVVDEAAMADTPRLASLLTHIGDGTVVGLGDELQLQAVGAGGGWLGLKRQAQEAGSYVELTRVYRQHHEWERNALDDVRHGRGVEAIAAYRVRDRIRITETRADARREVAETWNAARLRGATEGRPIADFVMVAATREDVDILNQWAQGMRLRAGELGPGTELTDREGSQTIRQGDRVRLEGRLDAEHPNGIRGVVTGVSETDLLVNWDDGHQAETMYSSERHRDGQLLRLDYAGTTQRTQGGTAEEAFVLPAPAQGMEALYSAFSRAREATTIWVDETTWRQRLSEFQLEDRRTLDRAELLAQLAVRTSESDPKRAALDAHNRQIRPPGAREARVEAARRKLDAYQRASLARDDVGAVAASREGRTAASSTRVGDMATLPSLGDLQSKLDQLSGRASQDLDRFGFDREPVANRTASRGSHGRQ